MISNHDGAPDQIYSGRSMHGTVLIVDDDHDISIMGLRASARESFDISELGDAHSSVVRAEIARLDPDVVLYLLAAKPLPVLRRDEILDTLRRSDYGAKASVVDEHIRTPHAQLKTDGRQPRFIAAVVGRAYRFLPTGQTS